MNLTKDDKKTEQPELTPEVIEAFMDARRQMVLAANKRLDEEER